MTDLKRLIQIIDAITYKPGTSFSIAPMKDGECTVRINLGEFPDSRGFGMAQLLYVVPPHMLPDTITNAEAVAVIFERVLLMEQHEAREWFRVGGQVYSPPPHGPNEL